MNKNKGFTVIETIVSFCLISVVSIMVLQIILSVRDLYIIGDVKTTMLVKQGIMVQKIQDDATKKGINRKDKLMNFIKRKMIQKSCYLKTRKK